MMDIAILGAGGQAREVAFLIEEINRQQPVWNIIGFVESDKVRVGEQVGKYKVMCDEAELLQMSMAVCVAIGNPQAIRQVAQRLQQSTRFTFPNLVHPSVIWDRDRISLGKGNIICPGNVLTTDIRIGSFNLLNYNSTYGHDTEIGDYCVINPSSSISGGVKIGDGCLIGTGARVLQYISIAEGATVGAGAVVTKDVKSATTVVGIPARPVEVE